MVEQKYRGGIPVGRKVLMANGDLKAVENIKKGDLLLSPNGQPVEVDNVAIEEGEISTIKQNTRHITAPDRAEIFGVLELQLEKRQQVLLRTKISPATIFETRSDSIVFYRNDLVDHITEDGRIIKLARYCSKYFTKSNSREEIIDYVKQHSKKEGEDYFDWWCEIQDIKLLKGRARPTTNLCLAPSVIENPQMRPWLAKYARKVISDKELVAMAWMIGFWLGDGHRTGAVFSLNSNDVDLNQFLKEQAELWGMTYRYVKQAEPEGNLCAQAYLHTYSNGLRNWNKGNPLTDTLRGLKFYAGGVLKRPKSFPQFVRTDEMMVREAILAGLLDSDGSTSLYRSHISMSITTVYPPLRDGILFTARSLGLNVSTYHAPAKAHETFNAQESWRLFISPGTNIERFFAVINKCGLERRRCMPFYPKKKRDS